MTKQICNVLTNVRVIKLYHKRKNLLNEFIDNLINQMHTIKIVLRDTILFGSVWWKLKKNVMEDFRRKVLHHLFWSFLSVFISPIRIELYPLICSQIVYYGWGQFWFLFWLISVEDFLTIKMIQFYSVQCNENWKKSWKKIMMHFF